MGLYKITKAKKNLVPIIISVPHAGTNIPLKLKNKYDKRMRKHLDDTDWFVDRLYKFAPAMGITLIKANLSRWVIDLNRDPESVPLYNDDRLITSNIPLTDFYGNRIYKSVEHEPNEKERSKRLKNYYWPYYEAVNQLLEERKKQFGHALLWDAHSIRHKVSTIQSGVFPDMILGDNDKSTAAQPLIETALKQLQMGNYKVNHNNPFKGGHITRYFGKPEQNIHSLQLEMNKIIYMDDNEITYNKKRAKKVQNVLQQTLASLIETMQTTL